MTAEDDLLAMLDASTTLVYVDQETGDEPVINAVYWGYIDVDETAKVIDLPLPYIVFNSSPGYDRDGRYCGQVGGRVLEFQLKGVGESEKQVAWVLNEGRKMLSRKRLDKALIRRSDDNLEWRRDDDFTRPGGGPIFYGVDRYGVAV